MLKIDDVAINKIASIKRCTKRVREEYAEDFVQNYSRQDAAILNIVRACEQAIDLANHIVRVLDLGVPNESRDSFTFLEKEKIIDEILAKSLKKMVSFRNFVIHEYEEINLDIVTSVILNNLQDLEKFGEIILNYNSK